MIKIFRGAGVVTPSKPPPPYEQLLLLPTPYFKMFLERSLNDPPPPHFKHLSLLPPTPSTTPSPPPKNFDHTLEECQIFTVQFLLVSVRSGPLTLFCPIDAYKLPDCFAGKFSEAVKIRNREFFFKSIAIGDKKLGKNSKLWKILAVFADFKTTFHVCSTTL